jgi:hypothetical protein
MTTTFSGHYVGVSGTAAKKTGGTALILAQSTENYILTDSATAIGGAGYSGVTSGDGGVGISLPGGGSLTAYGTITGGEGGYFGGTGGIGLSFATSGTLVNHGVIEGGVGGSSYGAGGIAVDFLAAGRANNSGQIFGGAGGTGVLGGGAGVAGLVFGAKGTLTNSGTITGGAGGYNGYHGNGGAGGVGTELKAGGFIRNSGNIYGGQGGAAFLGSYTTTTTGGAGGNGIELNKGGIVINSGSVRGGTGGEAPFVPNLSFIGSDVGGTGGTGINAQDGGIVINTGTITGGAGGPPNFESSPYPNIGSNGGIGVNLGASGYLINFGLIEGGDAGGAVDLGNNGNFGGAGGAGVVLGGNSSADVNFGCIIGGSGEPQNSGGAYGDGGLGVALTTAGTFINFGTITGGYGMAPSGEVAGGAGILLAGGSTLINAGSIAGGYSGADGYDANAVMFAGGGSRLIIDAGAAFYGTVEAAGSGNVLELTGHKPGTLDGLGSEFTGFQTVDVDAGSSWFVSGMVANMLDAGVVDIQNGTSLDITGAVNPSSAGIFQLTGKAALEIASLLGTKTKIAFLGSAPANQLIIDHPADFGLHAGTDSYKGPLLEDFGVGDSIDLKGIGSKGLDTYYNAASGVLQVTTSNGGIVASLQFQNSSLGLGDFHLASDNTGGSLLTRS